MTDVDRDAIGALLLLVESSAHRRGWDQEATMYVLYRADDDETARKYRSTIGIAAPVCVRGYAARRCSPPGQMLPDPAVVLFTLSLAIADSTHEFGSVLRAGFDAPGFVGFALCAEGWSRHESEASRESVGGRDFADVPGSIETRFVTAVDIERTDYSVYRDRGSKPRLTIAPPDDEEHRAGGSIQESLHAMTAAVIGAPAPKRTLLPRNLMR